MPAELTSTKAPAPVTPAPEGVLEAFVACLILSPVMAALYWQTYYAILTARNPSWGTRSGQPETAAARSRA